MLTVTALISRQALYTSFHVSVVAELLSNAIVLNNKFLLFSQKFYVFLYKTYEIRVNLIKYRI